MLDELNERAAIGDQLVFREHESGLVQGVVQSEACRGSFFLLGGHVAEFQPAGRSPLLFLSRQSKFEPGSAIRGGVPICFPWFGPHPDDSQAPAHGLVRTRLWDVASSELTAGGEVVVTLTLSCDPWKLSYRVAFGHQLDLELKIENCGSEHKQCEAALHTYLQLEDSRRVRIAGLEQFEYFDKLTQQACDAQGAPLTFTAETDRIYYGRPAAIEIQEENGRRLRIEPRHSQSTVVWNPWIDKSRRMPDFGDDEYLQMCCVETARVAADRLQIAAGEAATVGVRIGEA